MDHFRTRMRDFNKLSLYKRITEKEKGGWEIVHPIKEEDHNVVGKKIYYVTMEREHDK